MTYSVSFGFTGGKELEELLNQLKEDFGEKDAQGILTSAVRASMKPVLATAKSLVPVDTGLLRNSLHIQARKPSSKDRRSKYVSPKDTVIAVVTTKPIPKKIHKEAYQNFGYKVTTEKRKFYESKGHFYDARAVAMEFGTAKVAGKPYLRPALESSGSEVINSLSGNLKTALEKYKARQARKTLYGK